MVLDEFKNTCIDLIKMISVNLDNLIKDYEKIYSQNLGGLVVKISILSTGCPEQQKQIAYII